MRRKQEVRPTLSDLEKELSMKRTQIENLRNQIKHQNLMIGWIMDELHLQEKSDGISPEFHRGYISGIKTAISTINAYLEDTYSWG